MTAITLIETWLNSPADYSAGLLLFKQHSNKSFLVRMLESGPDNYNTTRLHDELSRVLAELQALADQRQATKPDILKTEQDEARKLMDERAELKAKLRFLAADPKAGDKRKAIAFKILDISSRLDNIYNTQEFYAEHGYLPTGKLDLGDDPVTLKARQATLRTYVCKYTKLSKNCLEEKKVGHLNKLSQYKAELAITDKKLEGFK